ncbi:MAG TPA: DNA topoisomerase IB [Solirubrobacteraceae bacterium]|nr:DNA topoisomerase IB [Solirubrobacteraceae bacterium]
MPRLRRSDCASPGISRRRRGRAVEYIDPDGARIDDPEVLERIGELAIPPAWREVWICLDPQGHLQATGIDAAGRKQYLYHDRWRAHRDRLKFHSMTAFGSSLPRLRRRVARDLRGEELTRERVLACVVRLLDLGFFRIGSEDYAERNESYGLTTMLKRHVAVRDGALVFDYLAKSGIRRVQEIRDTQTLEIITSLKARRGGGAQLFAYRSDGRWADVHSDEVNDYLKQASGGEFTAKDFRTWNATVLAAVALAVPQIPSRRTARERIVRDAVKTVAAYLGNTPAVCRASYIDPRVIDRYHAGVTIADALSSSQDGPDLDDTRTRKRVEVAVLELLE